MIFMDTDIKGLKFTYVSVQHTFFDNMLLLYSSTCQNSHTRVWLANFGPTETRCRPTHSCKSAASTSKKMLQVFNILLDTQAVPIHQYICHPTSLGGP